MNHEGVRCIGMNSIVLHGIKFEAVLKLGPIVGTAPLLEVGYEPLGELSEYSGFGVYLVYQREKLVYIGKYKNGLKTRWLLTRTKRLYHFKKLIIAEVLIKDPSTEFIVFAATEKSIRLNGGEFSSPWINVVGIEEELLRRCEAPLWNKRKKVDQDPVLGTE